VDVLLEGSEGSFGVELLLKSKEYRFRRRMIGRFEYLAWYHYFYYMDLILIEVIETINFLVMNSIFEYAYF